jgi:hypothetical protein
MACVHADPGPGLSPAAPAGSFDASVRRSFARARRYARRLPRLAALALADQTTRVTA